MPGLELLSGLWRLFPRQLRQRIYGDLTGLGLGSVAARRPEFAPPFTIVGPLRAPTGIGQSARLAVHALRALNFECSTFDVTEALLQPSTEMDIGSHMIREGHGTLLVFSPPPNASRALRLVPRRLRQGKTLVGCWVCETENVPPIWKRQAQNFHFLTAPTVFAATAIAAATRRPVSLLGHPVDAEPLPPASRTRSAGRREKRVVGAMLDAGSSASRKNVEGLLRVVELVLAQTETVTFHLKVRDLQTDPSAAAKAGAVERLGGGRVRILTANSSRDDAVSFIDDLDVLLSLSRAEGFGLPYAEAIVRGVAVAAPRWGGAAEILTDENSIALPFDLEPISDRSGQYVDGLGVWASVKVPVAADIVARLAIEGSPRTFEPRLAPLATLADFRDRLREPVTIAPPPIEVMT